MELQGVSQSAAQSPTQDVGELDQEVFLKLLLTELQHQDPMNPLDGREFIEQLATLSQVEQSRKTNEALGLLLQYQASINNAQAVSLLGKRVLAAGDEISYSGSPVELSCYLSGQAESVEVRIYDSSGGIVRTIQLGPQNEGLVEFQWDGLDNEGNMAQEGRYSFEVVAEDESGAQIAAQPLMEGVVEGLSFDADGLHLLVNGEKVSLNEIYEVMPN